MKEKKPTTSKPKPPAVFVHFGGAYVPLYRRLKRRAEKESRSVPSLVRLMLAGSKHLGA